MNIFDKILYNKAVYLTRKDITPEKINKYSKHILILYSILFLLTSFAYNFSLDGALFGVKISLNIIPAIFEIVIISLFTFIHYRYNSKFDYFIREYKSKIENLEQVSCVYEDDSFNKKIYKVQKDEQLWGSPGVSYIEAEKEINDNLYTNKNRYYFNDYRVFKFIDVKNGRKLKLKQLMENE